MTQLTRAAFDAQVNSLLADNEAGNISAEDVRTVLNNLSESAIFPEDSREIEDVSALLSDTSLTYTADQPGTVSEGDYVRTRAEGFSYEVAASGASDEHVTTAGGVKLYIQPEGSGFFNIAAFGPVSAASINSAFALRLGKYTLTPGSYALSANIEYSDNGGTSLSELDFSGVEFTGSVRFIMDGCKRVVLRGVYAAETTLTFRGLWYSTVEDSIFDRIEFADQAGSSFNSNYWNTYRNVMFSDIVVSGAGPHNKHEWINCIGRGDGAQGLPTSRPYALQFTGDTKCQQWVFRGGDLSYYSSGIYDIDGANSGDVHVRFTDVYFDDVIPEGANRARTRIQVDNCYAPGDKKNSTPANTASKTPYYVYDSDEGAGWVSYSHHNFVPNGGMEFSHATHEYDSTNPDRGGAIAVSSGATITENNGGPTGRYINIDQPNTGSNTVRFRSRPLPLDGRYSSTILIRNAGSGTKSLKFSFGGLFRAAKVGTEWTMLSLSYEAGFSSGSTQDVFIYTDDGTSFDVDVAYVGITYGGVQGVLPAKTPYDAATVARMGRTWEVIAQSANPVNLTGAGSTTRSEMASVTIPGGAMGPNGCLRVEALWSRNSGGAGIVTPAVRHSDVNGIVILGNAGVGTSFDSYRLGVLIQNRGDESSQIYINSNDFGSSSRSPSTTSFATASDWNLKFVGQTSDPSDTLTLERYVVEVCYGA